MSYYVYFENHKSQSFLIPFNDVAEGRVEQLFLITTPIKLTHVEIRDSDKQKNKESSYKANRETKCWRSGRVQKDKSR